MNKRNITIILGTLIIGISVGMIYAMFDRKEKEIKEIKIDNRCEVTAQALEKIYEDETNEYYLSSISSGCIYVIIDDKEYTLKEVINDKILTIDELQENGLKVYKEKK